MTKDRHPNNDIEEAIKYAEDQGWRVKMAGKSSHAWGRLLCPEKSRDGCIISIWTTPKVPENHAKQIMRQVDNCPHHEENKNAQ